MAPKPPPPGAALLARQVQRRPKPKPNPKNKKLGPAAKALVEMFRTYGLEELADEVIRWAKQGVQGSELLFKVRQSKVYKKRFPGMEALERAGYNAISEREYLELEDSYHRALESAGLPKGFYDKPQDFVKFMSNGLDPTEVHERAMAAVDLAKQVDPTQRRLLQRLYGVSAGDIAAYFLDPKRAAGILEKQVQAIKVGAAADRAGVGGPETKKRFERLVEAGVDPDRAASGYASIAEFLPTIEGLADVYGIDYDLQDAENEVFFGQREAQEKRRKISEQERSAFSGSSGFVATGDDSAGQF